MKRSKLELIIELLEAIERHPNFAKTRIFAYVGINSPRWKPLFERLNHRGFIQIKEGQKIQKGQHAHLLRITNKARDWLRRAHQLMNEIGGDKQ